jgi:hypothetical protein
MRLPVATLRNVARFGFVLSVAVVIIFACSSEASAQCVLGKTTTNTSQTDYIKMLAATTLSADCGAREIWVEAWISGLGTECLTGTPSGSLCKVVKSDGNNAVVSVGFRTCGPATGKSNHKAWNPYVAIEIERITPLSAACSDPPPDPVADCYAQGADYYWDGDSCEYTPGSPIVISTERNHKYEFTSVKDGVLFDINADGVVDQVAWTLPDSDVAFLALDRNGDGIINNGNELLGNHTRPDARNGFQALALMAMESNGGIQRGEVSSDDPLYTRLLLWTDNNHNGISERGELRPASEVLAEIGLSYQPRKEYDEFGNLFAYRGWAHLRTEPGRNAAHTAKDDVARTIHIWDVYFKMQ